MRVACRDVVSESEGQCPRLIHSRNCHMYVEEDERSVLSLIDPERDSLFVCHLRALFWKRALNFQRDKKAWLCTTIVPIIVVSLGFIICLITSPNRDLTPVTLDLAAFNKDITASPINPVGVNSPSYPYTCQPGTCVYYPIIVQEETGEKYTYCGTQALIGVTGADVNISAGQVRCSIDMSRNIIRTLDGFQGAVSIETRAETVLDVSVKWIDFSCFCLSFR